MYMSVASGVLCMPLPPTVPSWHSHASSVFMSVFPLHNLYSADDLCMTDIPGSVLPQPHVM